MNHVIVDFLQGLLFALILVASCVVMVVGLSYAYNVNACNIWEDLGKGECRSYLFESNYVMHDGEWLSYDEYRLSIGALK